MSKGAFELTRKIPLAQSAKEKWQTAARQLMTVEPVIDARVDQRGILRIRYDASAIGIHDIASLLDELGIPRNADLWWKLKLAWFAYVDENARANAHTSGGACCNRPPAVNGATGAVDVREWHVHE